MYGVVCTRRVLERVDLISRTLCVLDSDKAYLWQVRSGILGRVPVTDEIRLGVTSRAPPSRGLPVPIIGTDPAAGDREHRVDASSQVILRLVDQRLGRVAAVVAADQIRAQVRQAASCHRAHCEQNPPL